MRYLTYVPYGGLLNNARMCFEVALIIAFLTKRALVIPDSLYRPRDLLRDALYSPNPCWFFDMAPVRAVVPLVAESSYQQNQDYADLNFEIGEAVLCHPHIPLLRSRRLADFACGRRLLALSERMQLARTLRITRPTLEHFYTFIYCVDPREDIAMKNFIKYRMQYTDVIRTAASRISRKLGKFHAVHVRRTDFIQQYSQQNVAASRIVSNLLRHIPAGSVLYIATDETDLRFFEPFRSVYKPRFLADFGDAVAGLSPITVGCVEQMVCRDAEIFVGTHLSTFSSYITRLRGYQGSDAATYFTDGSIGSDADSVPFSWTSWLKTGNVLWGREYREGWNFQDQAQ